MRLMSLKTAATPTAKSLMERVDTLIDKFDDVSTDARALRNQRLQIKFSNALDKMEEVSGFLKYNV